MFALSLTTCCIFSYSVKVFLGGLEGGGKAVFLLAYGAGGEASERGFGGTDERRGWWKKGRE